MFFIIEDTECTDNQIAFCEQVEQAKLTITWKVL